MADHVTEQLGLQGTQILYFFLPMVNVNSDNISVHFRLCPTENLTVVNVIHTLGDLFVAACGILLTAVNNKLHYPMTNAASTKTLSNTELLKFLIARFLFAGSLEFLHSFFNIIYEIFR